MNVNSIKLSLYNSWYKSNPRNDDFDYLTFDGDESVLARWRLYNMNDNIVFRLINGLSVYV